MAIKVVFDSELSFNRGVFINFSGIERWNGMMEWNGIVE